MLVPVAAPVDVDLRAKKIRSWVYEAAKIESVNPSLTPARALMLALRNEDTALATRITSSPVDPFDYPDEAIYGLVDTIIDAWS